jgi:phosphatidylserine/phosphatidylglycerophosphate/cardiolipin synthase-like enzyme
MTERTDHPAFLSLPAFLPLPAFQSVRAYLTRRTRLKFPPTIIPPIIPAIIGRNRAALIAFALAASCAPALLPLPAVAATNPAWRVCFTPGGDCTDQIVDAIAGAQRRILVQAYSFTSAPIAQALLDAHKRGIDVQVILDRSQASAKYTGADFLANGGIPVRIDRRHAIAHNKVMVIDDRRVLTGSFNFTRAAQEKNAENLLLIEDKDLARQYGDNWRLHWAHSDPYRGKGAAG